MISLCDVGSQNSEYEFSRSSAATHAASLLGVSVDQMASAVFSSRVPSLSGLDQINTFVTSLYRDLLHSVTHLINR